MFHYKSFDYVKYILSLDFKEGYDLFKLCGKRIEEKEKDKLWDLYLIEIQNGYNGSFDNYYKEKIGKSEEKNMSYEDKENIEKDLISKYDNLDDSKFIKRRIK